MKPDSPFADDGGEWQREINSRWSVGKRWSRAMVSDRSSTFRRKELRQGNGAGEVVWMTLFLRKSDASSDISRYLHEEDASRRIADSGRTRSQVSDTISPIPWRSSVTGWARSSRFLAKYVAVDRRENVRRPVMRGASALIRSAWGVTGLLSLMVYQSANGVN